MKDKKDNGSINIKSKRGVITKNTVLIILGVILVAVLTGVISVNYVLRTLSVKEGKELTDLSNTKTELITERKVKKVISEVAPGLVSISDNEKSLEENKLNPKNTTGVIISEEGLIATTYSTISKDKDIYVKLTGKGVKPKKGILLGYNKDMDIALIKINAKNLTTIKVANPNTTKDGNIVFAIGNSTGDSYIGMITSGIVTSTNHKVNYKNDDFIAIQTNAVMNNENYGGVLCDSYGEIIGLNSKYLTEKFNTNNLYFAIEVNAVESAARQIIKDADILGIKGSEVNVGEKNEKGFYIESVKENGRGEKSGLKPTDIILTVDGKSITSYEDLSHIVRGTKKGDILEFKILRLGNEKTINIEI